MKNNHKIGVYIMYGIIFYSIVYGINEYLYDFGKDIANIIGISGILISWVIGTYINNRKK